MLARPPTPRTPPDRTRAVPWALALLTTLLLAVIGVAGAASASAHDGLESTAPSDGAKIDGPSSVTLTFSEDVLDVEGANRIVVTGPAGAVDSTLTVRGRVVTAALDGALPGGRYTVQWRVASADGHPVSGTFGFTSTAPVATSPSPLTSASPSASPSPSSSPPSPSGSAAPSPSPATQPVSNDEAGGPGRLLLLALVVLGALAAGTIVLAKRRARESS